MKRTCLQWQIIKIISIADQKMLNETVTLYIIYVYYIVLYTIHRFLINYKYLQSTINRASAEYTAPVPVNSCLYRNKWGITIRIIMYILYHLHIATGTAGLLEYCRRYRPEPHTSLCRCMISELYNLADIRVLHRTVATEQIYLYYRYHLISKT